MDFTSSFYFRCGCCYAKENMAADLDSLYLRNSIYVKIASISRLNTLDCLLNSLFRVQKLLGFDFRMYFYIFTL